jgi:predicted nuclease of predicted toxin-antitoxin system
MPISLLGWWYGWADLFPESVHLFETQLPRDAQDSVIWTYAKQNGFDIITADGDDYPPMAKRFGPPPKVILLESWRYPTRIALQLIRRNAILIAEFASSNQGLLILRL